MSKECSPIMFALDHQIQLNHPTTFAHTRGYIYNYICVCGISASKT